MMLFLDILRESWMVLEESAIYMLFGFFMAGLMKALIRPEHVSRYLGAARARSVVRAALIGIPIPL
ncbi:MAG: hypothetical protein ABIL58_26095 [Pseudomonadota bacterium]